MTVSSHTRAVSSFTGAATATVTFSGVPAVDETIVILDKDGTSKTFTAKGSESATALQFNQSGTAAAAATSLKACIDHANGHDESITVADSGAGVLTLTWAVGAVAAVVPNDSAFRTITSGLANVTVTNFVGGDSGVEDADGGVIFHGGNIGSGRLTNKSVLDMNAGSDVYGSQLAAITGTAHKVGLAVARTAGSPVFAFFPSPSDRTAANSTFLARGVQTKVAGLSSSEGIMGILGSNHAGRGINYHSEDHYTRGSWATLSFNLFRDPTAASSNNHGLVQSDGTAKSGATNYGIAAIHRNIADGDNAKPVANIPTRAIPGELVFLVDFVTRGSGGGNFQDYSAITGG